MKFSGMEKVAILFMALRDANAKRILEGLDGDEVLAISKVMMHMGKIDQDSVESVIAEFFEELSNSAGVVGNQKIAEQFFRSTLNDEPLLGKILDTMRHSGSKDVWGSLSSVDPSSIAHFLRNELPQMIAVILSKLPAKKIANILQNFEEERMYEILKAMYFSQPLDGEKLEYIETALASKLLVNSEQFVSRDKSGYLVAEIIDAMEKGVAESIIYNLQHEESDIYQNVKKHLFSFDELKTVSEDAIRFMLKEIKKDTLICALKDVDPIIIDRICSCMSARAAAMLIEEIDGLSFIQKEEVENARDVVTQIIKQHLAKSR